MNTNINKFKSSLHILLVSLLFPCCTKFVSVGAPPTELVGSTVFTSDGSAKTAIVGIYSNMMLGGSFASNISMWAGLSADELIDHSTIAAQGEFYQNALTPVNNGINAIWTIYQNIYQANAALEGLKSSTALTEAVKQQLTGEAKFIRAYCYFYLTNLFGSVPLVTTTNYEINKTLPRSSSFVIYQQILNDLNDAIKLLPTNYQLYNDERIRPTAPAAEALLSIVYLYLGDWPSAELQATAVINNNLYSLADDLDNVFLANSTEAIWQLQPVEPGYNTWDAVNFILLGEPTTVSINAPLLNAFEQGDLRRVHWIDSIEVSGQTYYFPFKYKVISSDVVTEYSMMLRLAEIYLIRSEAKAMQNDLTGSALDLNTIRARANLPAFVVTDQESAIKAIAHERQVELFTEKGTRWLDLKRTGFAGTVLNPIKKGWQPTDTLYPILQTEILNDANLTQNPGY